MSSCSLGITVGTSWVHRRLEHISKTLGTASDTGRSPSLELQAGLYLKTSNKDWEAGPDRLPLRSIPLPKGRKVKPRLASERLPSQHSHSQRKQEKGAPKRNKQHGGVLWGGACPICGRSQGPCGRGAGCTTGAAGRGPHKPRTGPTGLGAGALTVILVATVSVWVGRNHESWPR